MESHWTFIKYQNEISDTRKRWLERIILKKKKKKTEKGKREKEFNIKQGRFYRSKSQLSDSIFFDGNKTRVSSLTRSINGFRSPSVQLKRYWKKRTRSTGDPGRFFIHNFLCYIVLSFQRHLHHSFTIPIQINFFLDRLLLNSITPYLRSKISFLW